jgi:uncharacterized protein YqeY
MTIKQEIQNVLTSAMKSKDEDTKRTLRLLMTSIKMAEIEKGAEIEDTKILALIQKEVKTREDTITEAQTAERDDLIIAARKEIQILQQFLPQQMDAEELRTLAKEVIAEVKAASIKDMGKVMSLLMPKLQGRASGQDASSIVRDLLIT